MRPETCNCLGILLMAERQTLTIPLGGGLDRYSGPVVVDQGRSRDVRNVILTRGRARARDGYTDAATLTLADARVCDAVLDIRELPAEYATIITGYHTASREVWIFRGDAEANNPEPLGPWFTATGAGVPRVLSCEVNELVFLAHDERHVNRRAATYRYDGSAAAVVAPLTVAWRDTSEPPDEVLDDELVRFRGVVEHLGLLVGWGWGTPDDEDRPEILRHSRPEGPTILEPNDYGLFGARGTPIIACGTGVGAGLLVQKQKETHALLGYGSRTFRPELLDARFGAAGSRLGLEVGGAWYVWTVEGPAVSEGGPLTLLELPLDLGAPEPADLVAMGAVEDGFALYVPGLRLVQWVFGRRVYTLSVVEPGKWEWSYDELADEVRSGVALSGLVAAQPTGYPDAEPTTDIGSEAVTVHWLNIDADGDELCEIWLKGTLGAWTRHESVRVVGDAQPRVVDGLLSGTDYEGALRYRRGSLYTAGYEGADPALWPAVSRFTFKTELAGAATISSSWERTSATDEQIVLSFDDIDPTAEIEVYYREAGTADPFVLLTAEPLAPGTLSYIDAWIDTDLRGEMLWEYKVVETIGPNTRESLLERWAGPDEPGAPAHRVLHSSLAADWYAYTVDWTTGANAAAAETDVRDDYYCPGTFQHRQLEPAGDQSATVNTLEKNSVEADAGQISEWPFEVRLWHKLTTFGVIDWSRYASVSSNVRIADDETAQGSCGGSGTGGGGGDPPLVEAT